MSGSPSARGRLGFFHPLGSEPQAAVLAEAKSLNPIYFSCTRPIFVPRWGPVQCSSRLSQGTSLAT